MTTSSTSFLASVQHSEVCQRLARWLPDQRWFAGKSQRIERLTISDLVTLPTLDGGQRHGLALASIDFADGASDVYLIPLELTGLRESLSPGFW